MKQCKWEKDDFKQTSSEFTNAEGRLCKACVNADCEHCADFCNHYENSQECECYEAENASVNAQCDMKFIYWEQ